MTELRWAAATDIGMVREKNDDSYLLAPPLFAVADGMGGALGGDVASATAVEALRAAFEDGTDADALVAAIKEANRAVFEKAGSPKLRGMGTTMTALALMPRAEGAEGEMALVNVGDSRGYLLRDGELQQLTDDHNVPGELLRRGELTAAQAAVHPQRNLITRVLGTEDEVEVDVWQLVPYAGDRFLLASDGLFGEVPDERIAPVLRTEADPQVAAHKLVDMARAAGGSDNITVVIVDVVDDGGRAEAASTALAGASRTSTPGEVAEEAAVPTEEIPSVTTAPVADDITPEAPSPSRRKSSGARLLLLLLVGALIGGAAAAAAVWYGFSPFADEASPRVTTTTSEPPTTTSTLTSTTTSSTTPPPPPPAAPPPPPAPAP
jgi:protein phosphatase